MKAAFSIAIVDNSRDFREGLKNLIKHDIHVEISLFCTGEELLDRLDSGTRYDVYILGYKLDASHRHLWGDEVYKEILIVHREPKVILLTDNTNIRILSSSNGVYCLPKDAKSREILLTVERLLGIKQPNTLSTE